MDLLKCELWICVDAGGDYAVGKDEDEAKTAYEDTVQPLADCSGFRLLKITVNVPTPTVRPELTGTAPEEGQATLSVK